MKKFSIDSISRERQYSMQNAFSNDSIHKRFKDVALHVGVSPTQARGYLEHLIKKGEISRANRFALMLKKSKLQQAKRTKASKGRGVRR